MLSEIASIITIGEFIAEMLRKENDDAASDFNAFLEGIKKKALYGFRTAHDHGRVRPDVLACSGRRLTPRPTSIHGTGCNRRAPE